jgi:hypothetical protein
MSKLPAADAAKALQTLRQALGTAATVVARTGAANANDAEVLRDGAPPIPIRLAAWQAGGKGMPETVWVLRKPSRGTLAQLRGNGQNFIVPGKAVRLVAEGLILDRSDLRAAREPSRPPRRVDPFSDRNSLVVRTLLEEPDRRWGVREIANAASVSAGTASQVVRALAAMGTVDFRRRGRNAELWVTDPMPLIRRWAGTYSWERNQVAAFAPPMGDPLRFLKRKHPILHSYRWALTLQAGASLISPHAAWERVHLYVNVPEASELFEIAAREGWPYAEDGRLVLMKPYYRHSVWQGTQTVDGLPVVSDVQLVLDLWNYPLRGLEQAEHILATRGPRR